ncbi:hypothetical protein L7F22_003300 [Adiantum nelumboides]|nr:hypothetical protein [Adiantum nelumboides]
MATLDNSQEVARIDSKAAAKIASNVSDYNELVHDAAEAAHEEKAMGVLESIRAYPKAVIFSVGISLAIVMEGYDTILLGNFYAQPAFQKKFGVCDAAGKCQVTAAWQAGLSNGSQIGSLLGLQLVGWLSDKYGYRKTMMGSLALMTAFTFLPVFAENLVTLLMGQLLQGVPWGIYQSLAVAYAADVCPVSLRPILTTYVNLCWVMGQLIAAGVLRATVERSDKWAYKIPYTLQFMWIPLVLTFVLLAPESPWYLVRAGRLDDAEKSILKLQGKSASSESARKTVAMLKHTDELEKTVSAGASYWDLFKGTNLRRTEIGAMAWLVQQFCGSPLMGMSSYFLIQAGLPTTQAFNLTIGQFSIGAVGTISSWFIMRWMGRRTIYLVGQILMVLILLAVGVINVAGGTPWAIGALLLCFTFIYDVSVGPACYSLVAEIPSTRLRAKSVVFSRGAYNLAGILINVINPRMLNPDAWNLSAKSAFVWMGTGLVFLVWTYFRLPEPKGRTYGELDILFEAKVPARKFKSTKIDEFGHFNVAHSGAAVISDDSSEKKSEKGDIVNTLNYGQA